MCLAPDAGLALEEIRPLHAAHLCSLLSPITLLQRRGRAQTPCSSPHRRRVLPAGVDTVCTPPLSAALRDDKKPSPLCSLTPPHSFPPLTSSLAFLPLSPNPGQGRRRASPAIECSPSQSQTTSTFAVLYSPSLRQESQREVRDRRRHPHPFPLRPPPCREARGLHRSYPYAIFIPPRSPRRELSHGHLLFS